MSKLSVVGLVANIAATAGIAAPMGIEINKEKHYGGWNSSKFVDGTNEVNKVVGTGTFTSPEEYWATQEMYNWLCYEHIWEKKINLKRFCLINIKTKNPEKEITLVD